MAGSLTYGCWHCGQETPTSTLGLGILDLLETDGGWVHSDHLKQLAQDLGYAPSSAAQYLSRLKKAGLVEVRHTYPKGVEKAGHYAEYRLAVGSVMNP